MNILNPDQKNNNAIILCSNPIQNSCVWPLDTGRKEILGRSDVSTLVKIVHEKNKLDSFGEKENLSNQEKFGNIIENSEVSTNSVDPVVQEFNKSSEKNQEKNLIENSEESTEILQESSHDLSNNSVDPDADTESEGIQEAIDPWSDIDTDFMSLPEMKIQEIKSFSKEKEVSKEKTEENQEKEEGEITRENFDFPL